MRDEKCFVDLIEITCKILNDIYTKFIEQILCALSVYVYTSDRK